MSARAGRYAAAYTHREPSRDDELRLLLRWIVGQPANGLLFVGPEARAIDNSTIASGLVRSGNALYTTWRNKDSWRQERVIALWPNAKVLQQLDDVSTVKALGVLTWLLDDVAPWASGVGAVDVLGEATAETPTIQDPVVLGALRSLTNSVNRSTGLGHPSDWDHAVQMFRTLRKRGHAFDGDEIEAWAIANGWSYRHAAQVGQLAREIAAGKTKRTKSRASWAPTAATVEHWREVGADGEWSPV
jgi:hypothetical protein